MLRTGQVLHAVLIIIQKFNSNEKIHSFYSYILNFQYSNSTDVPRYDRLTDPKGTGLASSQWYYGPQKRLLTAYQFQKTGLSGFFNNINFNANYQDVEEVGRNIYGAVRYSF